MTFKRNKVPRAVVSRLPAYYRYLINLEKAGLVRISSQQLGERMGLTASQIRQDINCFGGFGQQGYGYNVAELRGRIGAILGLTHKYRCIVVGAGNIGLAVSGYAAFRQIGFVVEALFDVRPQALGYTKGGLPVLSVEQLPQYLAENPIDVGVLAVPEGAAQPMCDLLVKGGVKAIWNFAPVDLSVPDGVTLNSVHLQDTLLVLSYYMTNPAKADERSE
ncbi:MAG TPA: redox-sensing transcriptional repressor Rex [Candidatus Excrementavichristensenella intestinipullorum]|nr:redox-sensing transcriptional repressor Rex [Candidatus Excrementavichristensenella intestinipullorum]